MPRQSTRSTAATVGIDIGKNVFHLVGLDQHGHIVMQLKTSRGQLDRRVANVPRCLIGMEACSGAERNRRDFALQFFADLRAKTAAAGGPPPLGLHVLMGRTTPEKVQNMIANIAEGCIAPVELIACKL